MHPDFVECGAPRIPANDFESGNPDSAVAVKSGSIGLHFSVAPPIRLAFPDSRKRDRPYKEDARERRASFLGDLVL